MPLRRRAQVRVADGLLGVPLTGTAAATRLVLCFVCALFAYLRVRDYAPQFYLAMVFVGLAAATLARDPALALSSAR